MKPTPIYMFHAIGVENDLVGADPHYALSSSKFFELISKLGGGTSIKEVLSGRTIRPILTFDDGHITNYNAAKILFEEFNSQADFFINTSNVGKDNFLNWDQLREMQSWGMSIQSHGHEHIYLSDLDRNEQCFQVRLSKEILEHELGERVTILAPPGGRYNQDTQELITELGYEHLTISKPGKWSGQTISPRIPILSNSNSEHLASCQNGFSLFLMKQEIKYKVMGVAKTLLGNHSYDALRSRILGV